MIELQPPLLDRRRHALLLDFDGTFVDFAPRPELVRLREGGIELLSALQGLLDGAVAVVSGRRIADLDGFLHSLQLPAIGVHGQESRTGGGEIRLRPVSPELDTARRRIAGEIGPSDPLTLEDKGSALVLHFRLHPEAAGRAAALAARAIEGLGDLHALPGNNIVEIRQSGVSKADAWPSLAAAAPFQGRVPVFIGDDTTDEDGFRAAADAGGFGIKVGPGATAAAYRLADPAAVHAWLRQVVNRGENAEPGASVHV